MKKFIVLFSVMLLSVTISYGQENTTYRQTLQKMMQVTGAQATYNAVIEQMISAFKVQKPEVPAAVWNEFGVAFSKSAATDILDLLLPIYQKHFTEEDLKATITFYETPAGQKLALKSPIVMREAMQAGQQWGAKIGEEFVKKLKEKGY